MRIGIGYDLHRLAPGRRLMIGGVEIPFMKGLIGHSDADVLIHAVADAILGACGQQDLGQIFPDTDPQFKNISGEAILTHVMKLVDDAGFVVSNVDSVLIAEQPKFGPYKPEIRKRLAELLQVSVHDVNVKAKTAERTGEIGAGDAIAAHAVVLLKPSER